jgi:autoinducer 2-degrading protein
VPDDDIDGVLNELPNHIELTRKEIGCLVFNVAQDESDKSRFSVYEEFENKASFEQHQNRVRTSTWGEITKNVERNYNIEGLNV